MSANQSVAVAVYSPDPFLRRPRQLLRQMVRDLVSARELTWFLLLRNFRAQYRQSLLGYLWIVLNPVATTLVWTALHLGGVLNLGQTEIAYPLYVLVGSMLWQGFVEAVNSPLSQLTGSKTMLTKVNFPKEALILAGLGEILVNAAVRLLVVLVVLVVFRVPIPPTAIAAPGAILALIGLGTALGLLLVPFGMLYLDVQRGLGVIVSFWFLATPIVYAVPTSGPLALVAGINPATPALVTSRELLTTGQLTYGGQFLVVLGLTVVGLIMGWILYRVAMPHVVARMPAR